MISLKRYRSRKPGLSDLLNFACLPANGVLLGKDGSLSAFYSYRGDDIDSASPDELAALSGRVNAAIAKLGTGWMLKTDVIRRKTHHYPMPQGSFPNELTQRIDDERRELFESSGLQFETLFILTLTYLPPLSMESRFYSFLVEDDADKATSSKKSSLNLASKHLNDFEKNLSEIERDLSSDLSLRRLKSYEDPSEESPSWDNHAAVFDEILEYLNYVVTGKRHPIRLPSIPMYIDSLLAYDDLIGGFAPRIGSKKIAIISVDGFPEGSSPALLHALTKLRCEYRWNTRFIFMSYGDSRNALESLRKKWQQKVRGFKDQIFQTSGGRVDEHALMQVGDVDSALAVLENGSVSFGLYTGVFVLLEEEEEVLRENENRIMKAVADLGFSCRKESINAVEAWLGSLPSHSNENVRKSVIHSLNLADLLPVSTIWSGEDFNPHPKWARETPPLFQAFTDGNTAFRGHLHSGDVGHFLVIGPTGGGKSLLLNFLDAQFLRFKDARIFAFDKKYSKFAFCKGAGGIHYDLLGESLDSKSISLCPLGLISTSEKEKNWAKEWISNLCRYQGLTLTPTHIRSIHEAMDSLARSEVKSLTDFVATVQNEDIRNTIAPFTLSGSVPLLDGTSDSIQFSNIQVIELEHLMDLKDHNALPILEYIFHKIESSLDGKPVLLTIDEAWIALQHPVFAARIKQWLKEMRSKNVCVGLATQTLSDADKSGIMDDITESCPTKIFTSNPNAIGEEARKFYIKLGLTDAQIRIIANLTPKREYYFVQPKGARVIDLAVGPYTLKWLGTGDLESVLKLKNLIKEHPETWRSKWD